MTRIVLIHAVTVAMAPIEIAFRRLWPEVDRVNILDDSLSPDRERDGRLTEAMIARIGALARYGAEIGADGILYTCSAFGEAIAAAAAEADRPVLKPNEAMFRQALRLGTRIGMLATFEPSVASMEQEFREMAVETGTEATLRTICVPAAMAALKVGDRAGHDRLLAEAAPALEPCDAVLLAHFSTAAAEAAVAEVVHCPVLTSPGSAVLALKAILQPGR